MLQKPDKWSRYQKAWKKYKRPRLVIMLFTDRSIEDACRSIRKMVAAKFSKQDPYNCYDFNEEAFGLAIMAAAKCATEKGSPYPTRTDFINAAKRAWNSTLKRLRTRTSCPNQTSSKTAPSSSQSSPVAASLKTKTALASSPLDENPAEDISSTASSHTNA